MPQRSTQLFGICAALFSLPVAAAVGCGHSTFNFPTDEASSNSGSGGGSPPPMGSGGRPPVGSGGFPPFVGSGGFTAAGGQAGGQGGGEGGGPACVGPGCPGPLCCGDLDITCDPFEPCDYCSRPDQCSGGKRCDPLSDQCLPGCDDDFDCPDHALPLCDESRGVCIQCYEDVHCPERDMTCHRGFCVWCDERC